MSLELPVKPNLEHLKKQAKVLLSQSQQGDAAAIERFRSLVSFSTPASLKLARRTTRHCPRLRLY